MGVNVYLAGGIHNLPVNHGIELIFIADFGILPLWHRNRTPCTGRYIESKDVLSGRAFRLRNSHRQQVTLFD